MEDNNNNTSRKRLRDSSYSEDYSYGRQYPEIEQAMSFNFEPDSALLAELTEWQPSPAVFPPTSPPTIQQPEPAAPSTSKRTGKARTAEQAQKIQEQAEREAPGRKAESQSIVQWRKHIYDRLPKEKRDIDNEVQMPTSRKAQTGVNKKLAFLMEDLAEELGERGVELRSPLLQEWMDNVRRESSVKNVDDIHEKFKKEQKDKQSDQPKQ